MPFSIALFIHDPALGRRIYQINCWSQHTGSRKCSGSVLAAQFGLPQRSCPPWDSNPWDYQKLPPLGLSEE